MALSSKINKIIKTSPEVLIKKAFRKAYGKIESKVSRKLDLEFSTYIEESPRLELKNDIINMPSDAFLKKYENEILFTAEKSLSHQFKLLNPNYLDVSYNSNAPGKDGLKFDSEIASKQQAKKNINEKNLIDLQNWNTIISENYTPIDWQKDFISGYRWSEATWYKDLRYGFSKGADVKVPWELGRMQDLPNLAFAYKIQKKESFLQEFTSRVIDFYEMNPPRYGVQWKTAMDVGIRAVNVLATYLLFKKLDCQFEKSFEQLLDKFIYQHIQFIDDNNEFSEGQRGNHYLTNVVSILLLSINFEQNAYCDQLIEKYSTAYVLELNYQFYDDGGNFEASLPYHLLSSELILVAFNYFNLLDPKSNLQEDTKLKITNKEIQNKVKSILKFTQNTLHSGYVPKIGDHDSGRYFTYLSNIHFYYSFFNEAHIFQGFSEYSDRNSISKFIQNNSGLVLFKDSGFATFKNDNYEITASFSKLGQAGKGGHNHNDSGSFVLSLKSRPFIIDPGTYCYTSNWNERNKFRSTSYHNTLSINGIEQNIIYNEKLDDLFWLFAKGEPFSINSDNHLKIVFNYYKKPHIRDFTFQENKIVIKDHLELDKKKKISFHLHPKIEVEISKYSVLLSRDNIEMELLSDQIPQLEDYYYSPNYGTKIPSKHIVFEMPSYEQITEFILK